MMSLEVDLAVYKRLTGAPVDSSGRPQTDGAGVPINRERIGPTDLNPYERIYDEPTGTFIPVLPVLPSYGIRLPHMRGSNSKQGMTTFNQDGLPLFGKFEKHSFRQVPVFDQNVTGRDIENIWPCVTFRWMGMDFDPKVFLYSDHIQKQDVDSNPVQIRNRNNEVIQSGYEKNLVRPLPESWPMVYVITAWAKNLIELGLICTQIAHLFPGRGAINVQFADGTTHACDMLLRGTETLDEGGNSVLMTRGAEEQRNYARAFIYTIESYLDNTVNAYGVEDIFAQQAVTERILELDKIMGDLAVQESNSDLNLAELKPITA